MTGPAAPGALPSLALFCATALAHRHLAVRHERSMAIRRRAREQRHARGQSYRRSDSGGGGSCRSSMSVSPPNAVHDDDDDEHHLVHQVRLRKRVSFDGLPSDHFQHSHSPGRDDREFGREEQQHLDAESFDFNDATTESSSRAPPPDGFGRSAERHQPQQRVVGGSSSTSHERPWCSPLQVWPSAQRRRASEESDRHRHPANCNWSHFEMQSEESRQRLGIEAAATTARPSGRRSRAWAEEEKEKDQQQQSFVIYGGDEMDDDEAGGGGGGVLTSAGALAMRAHNPSTEHEAKRGEKEADQSSSATAAPSWHVGGIFRRLSSIGGGAGFFADAIDEVSYPGDDDSQQQRPGGVSPPEPEPEYTLPSTKRSYQRMESARADYNAKIMPSKVVMVRHGQSEGNVEEALYATTPDNAMKLTSLGWDQARMAGKELRERILPKGESVHFVVSPYVRTVETFHGMVSAWCDPSEFDHIQDRDQKIKAWYGRLMEMGLTWHEDPRIREQDFGNYQDPVAIKKSKRERHEFGTFYYRFPHGESASDVFDRASTFLDSLWRSFDLKRSQNYVLVTHGISIRVLLARYFRYSIDQFNLLANPKNCDMVILGHDGEGKLRMEGRCELELKNISSDSEGGRKEFNPASVPKQIVGYKFHDRLRILPKKYIRQREIRLSFDDQ